MGVDAGGEPDVAALRRGVLAVAVLDDVDLEPTAAGVAVGMPGGAPVVVAWDRVRAACGDGAPEAPVTRLRIATLLRTSAALPTGDLRVHARALALPPGHPLHPGPGWVRERVRGGLLDVGIGLVDLPWPAAAVEGTASDGAAGDGTASDGTASDGAAGRGTCGRRAAGGPVPLPPAACLSGHARVTVESWWPDLRGHALRMGTLAATRIHDAPGVLRPVGGCDVLTLLGTRPLRAALAGGDGSGMRAVAVPTRQRGWFDLRRVDPAFVGAAWAATTEADRGLSSALLVTRDEVATARRPSYG